MKNGLSGYEQAAERIEDTCLTWFANRNCEDTQWLRKRNEIDMQKPDKLWITR